MNYVRRTELINSIRAFTWGGTLNKKTRRLSSGSAHWEPLWGAAADEHNKGQKLCKGDGRYDA